ncbi:MAG: ATP-binding protein [Planctomycetota bacterium]
MRLFTRFLILIVLITGVAAGTLLAAGWTVISVQRDVTVAYENIVRVIDQLDRTRVGYEFLLLDISQGQRELGSSDDRQLLRQQLRSLEEERLRLVALADLPDLVGPATTANLTARSEAAALAMDTWLDQVESGGADSAVAADAFDTASSAFQSFHQLVERVEQRLLDDAGITVNHAQELRLRLQTLLIICLLVMFASGVLAALLFRRWMILPVMRLREATAELSQGNFDHRIDLPGHDELAVLAREVNSMAATVVDTQQRLVERERLAAVGEMMRRLVHNLRNPLAGIRSLAEITRYELDEASDLRENQDRIVSAVDRFEAWLNEMLRSTSPMHVHLQQIAPGPLLERAVESIVPHARGKSIEVAIELDPGLPEIEVDPLHIEQAAVSLLSNAVDMTPKSGRIMVRVEHRAEPPEQVGDMAAMARTGGWWLLTVDDSGPGVPPHLRDRVFAPYFTTRKHGSGIGLAMVQNIARSHDGRAWVESSPLGGARFVLAMPLHPVSPASEANSPAPAR